jgi:hypothetical protein
MDYYVKHGEGEKGPYTEEVLRESFSDGTLRGSSLVRADGSEGWKRLDVVVEPRRRAPARSSDVDSGAAAAAARRAAGERNMLVGGLICVVGIVITAATYSSAANGGGRYVVAWGAIIFGALRFFRGMASR